MDCPTRMLCFVLLFLGFFVCGGAMADGTVPGKTEVQLKQEKKGWLKMGWNCRTESCL